MANNDTKDGAGGRKVRTDGQGRATTQLKNDPRNRDENSLIETDLNGTPIQDETDNTVPIGTGDRLVVLHHVLTTPQGGAFTRGQVISESLLYYPKYDLKGMPTGEYENELRPELRSRLFDESNPALRKATAQEGKAGFVDLPDDEELARMQLAEAQAAESSAENASLKQQLDEANRRAEEAEAKLQQQANANKQPPPPPPPPTS